MAQKTRFINVRFTEDLYKEIHSLPIKPSKFVRQAVTQYLQFYKMENKKPVLKEGQNYIIMGKTQCGKTFLVKELLKETKKRKLIIDPHKEYVGIGIQRIVKNTETHSSLISEEKVNFLVKTWMKDEIEKITGMLNTDIVLQPEFDDPELEKIFFSELFKQITEKNKDALLVVAEEGKRYAESIDFLVGVGIKRNIQTVIVSQAPIKPEIMANLNPIIGCVTNDVFKELKIPERVSEIALVLKPQEWIWIDTETNLWKKYTKEEKTNKDNSNLIQSEIKSNSPIAAS